MVPEPLSAKNAKVKRLRRLVRNRKARSQERAFVVDGPVLVVEALRSQLDVEGIYLAAGALDLYPELAAWVSKAAQPPPLFQLERTVLEAVLDPVSPRLVGAVVAQPSWGLGDLTDGRPVVAVHDLGDPGNLGTIVRSAEGAGAGGLVLVGNPVDPYGPKVVRASAGAVLRTPLVEIETLAELAAFASSTNRPLLAADIDDRAVRYDLYDLTKAVLLLGNEPHGLPDEARGLSTDTITIPLEGDVESLNVAAAAAILCFEASRQRRSTILD